MVKFSFSAVVAASLLVSGTAFAQSVTTVATPEAYTAPVYGSGDVVVSIPQVNDNAVQTVAPVEYVAAAAPLATATLDMSGADGSLRACYANDGIAKQREDFSYFCNYEKEAPQASTASSAYTLPAGVESSYQGTTDIADETLIDCVNRGGSLIQLAANGQFACAM